MELAKRGHQVTVITTDPVKDHGIPEENFRQIDVHDVSYKMWKEMFDFVALKKVSPNPIDLIPMLSAAFLKILDAQIITPQVQEIIRNKTEQFDLLLLETMSLPVIGFVWRFQTHLIGVSSFSEQLPNFDAIGNPSHPVLYPDVFRHKAGELNLWDRIYTVYSDLWVRYATCFNNEANTMMRRHFGGDMPSLMSLKSRIDMLFLGVNFMLAGIRPAVPALENFGGLHLKEKNNLPKDLQEFLDESPEGVVYMSLGSNVMSKNLPPEMLRMVTEVFRGLPYRVLWKYEEELLNRPKNVRTSKWLPQQDLLGHPNIKVFITQGGHQSMLEAIRDGVPLIGIPFMADQDYNVQTSVLLGIGVSLNINTLNKENFEDAIMNVTKDPKYKQNIKRLSELMSDQPMSGLERAVWWTEHILRHRGAGHLRAPAADASISDYFMLDVLALVAGISAAASLSFSYIVVVVCKRIHAYWEKVKTH